MVGGTPVQEHLFGERWRGKQRTSDSIIDAIYRQFSRSIRRAHGMDKQTDWKRSRTY
jgi:hypothetical protein